MTRFAMVLLVVLLIAGQTPQPKPPLAEPARLGFAGIKIAIPEGFQLRPPDGRYLVLHARKIEDGVPVMGLKLLAYFTDKSTSVANFVKATGPDSDRAFTDVTVKKEKPITVSGAKGHVRVLNYNYRGKPLSGIWMFFLRPVAKGGFQMGYVLSVEADKSRSAEILPALIPVSGSIELFDPVRPITEKITLADEPIVSRRLGFAIRPPAWWKVTVNKTPADTTVNMFQTDYLFLGMTHPAASFSARPGEEKSADRAQKDIDRIAAYLRIKKIESEVIHKAPAKMAGKEGYEIILSHAIPPVADCPKKRMLAVRTVCAEGMTYSLKLEYDTEKKEEMMAVMDAIAAGLALTTPVEDDQATTTAATTQTSAPASGPATQPAADSGRDETGTAGQDE